MTCFNCQRASDYRVYIDGAWSRACNACLYDPLIGRRVEKVIGRLRAEIERGDCDLDATAAPRHLFDPEIDGRATGVRAIISADPMVIRFERAYFTTSDDYPRFDRVTEQSVIVLREFSRLGEVNKSYIERKASFPRSGPGVVDAVAFTLSEPRVVTRTLYGVAWIAPDGTSTTGRDQHWEILTGRVNWLDVDRYVELPSPV